MKNVTISYNLFRGQEITDANITLPMQQKFIDILLTGNSCNALESILSGLAELQGCDKAFYYGINVPD